MENEIKLRVTINKKKKQDFSSRMLDYFHEVHFDNKTLLGLINTSNNQVCMLN